MEEHYNSTRLTQYYVSRTGLNASVEKYLAVDQEAGYLGGTSRTRPVGLLDM